MLDNSNIAQLRDILRAREMYDRSTPEPSVTPARQRLIEMMAALTAAERLTLVTVLKYGQYDGYTWDKAAARAAQWAFLGQPDKLADYGHLARWLRMGLERLGVDPQ